MESQIETTLREDYEEKLKQANEVIRNLAESLAAKESECSEIKTALSKAVVALDEAGSDYDRIESENSMLRKRYEEQSKLLADSLWKRCVNCNPECQGIPKPVDPSSFVEKEDQVGPYVLSDRLGEGQFAEVRTGFMDEDKDATTPFAVKTIKKFKLKTHASLRRLSNEVINLKALSSPYVIHMHDCINTEENFYIVAEKGGDDLFSFSGKYANGMNPAWVKEIMVGLMRGVTYIHRQGICHRDLKPENVLMEFDTETGKCKSLKICDFGLSARFRESDTENAGLMNEFCGSPGFFAPEMLVRGTYHGDKVDLWSVACIMLELTLGHVGFGNLWMKNYAMETIRNKEAFDNKMRHCLEELPSHLRTNYRADVCDFLIPILTMCDDERPDTESLARHAYYAGEVMRGLEVQEIEQAQNPTLPMTPRKSGDSTEEGSTDDEASNNTPRKCQSWRLPDPITPPSLSPLSSQSTPQTQNQNEIGAEVADAALLQLPPLEDTSKHEGVSFFHMRMPSFRKRSTANRSPIFLSRQVSRSGGHNNA